jgi:sugar fermentation stimulation protein A
MNPDAGRFVPNLHTDPAFAGKLIAMKDKIWMRAVSIRTGEDGQATVENLDVPIALQAASAVEEDQGSYFLVILLKRQCTLTAASLGSIQLEPGWYVYVGSGMQALSARIARHHRRRKKLHWHIDYLLDCAESRDITSLPIRCRHRLECSLAQAVAGLAVDAISGFGSSDCNCFSHLFRFDSPPLHSRLFLDLLLHYRHSVALA